MGRLRPFIAPATSEIFSIGQESVRGKDLETYSFCVAELGGRRGRNARLSLEQLRESTDMLPISWIEEMAGLTHSQQWLQSGSRRIYIVLLSRAKFAPGTYGIYVGETGLTPEERFQQHLDGIHASWHVRERGLMLLPRLYSHLNSLNQEDAKQRQRDIADLLYASGLCEVQGG